MISKNKLMLTLVIIRPKFHVINYIKQNTFFNKIIGLNNIKENKINK
jgi:hypothetical protein